MSTPVLSHPQIHSFFFSAQKAPALCQASCSSRNNLPVGLRCGLQQRKSTTPRRRTRGNSDVAIHRKLALSRGRCQHLEEKRPVSGPLVPRRGFAWQKSLGRSGDDWPCSHGERVSLSPSRPAHQSEVAGDRGRGVPGRLSTPTPRPASGLQLPWLPRNIYSE